MGCGAIEVDNGGCSEVTENSLKRAFLFPGQGSQYVGMMKDLYAHSELAREIIDSADDILGYTLSTICFDGPVTDLQQTENTQPAIFLHGYILYKLLSGGGIVPEGAAGHSLGEYTALVAAGALSYEDALKVVRLRGMLMQKAGEDQPGTMAAVVGLGYEMINNICVKAAESGIVQAANFNSPGQVVISGSVEAVTAAMALAKQAGARLVKELVVSGAFHSPLMKPAQDALAEALSGIRVEKAHIPVYTNVTAEPIRDPDSIRKFLRAQITAPVLWEQSMRAMLRDGFNDFTEVGPGKVLQGLLKRLSPDIRTRGIDKWEDLGKMYQSQEQ
jgi:[acyl-carrier-protein] S-malonyltransferase